MKMIVKVNDFNASIKKIDDSNGNIIEKLNNLKKQIGELRSTWQGEDSDIFTNQAERYIEYLNSVPKILDDLSSVMKKTSESYVKLDQEYAEQMKKAVVRHE